MYFVQEKVTIESVTSEHTGPIWRVRNCDQQELLPKGITVVLV